MTDLIGLYVSLSNLIFFTGGNLACLIKIGRIVPSMMGFPELDNRTAVSLAIGVGCGFVMGWLMRGRRLASSADIVSKVASAFSESGDFKMILVVRTDLKMGKGKIAAQSSHAAVDCYRKLIASDPEMLRRWEMEGQPKIVLRTDTEESLIELYTEARKLGLRATIIQDAGRTQITSGTKTVLGIGPGPAETIDMVTGHLKLF